MTGKSASSESTPTFAPPFRDVIVPESLGPAVDILVGWADNVLRHDPQFSPVAFQQQVRELARLGCEKAIEVLTRSLRDGAKVKPYWEDFSAGRRKGHGKVDVDDLLRRAGM